MLPTSVPDQSFLATADLSWTIDLSCPGDCPPAGTFEAHMKADLSELASDKVFSEARGNLVRGEPDAEAQTIPLTFISSRDENIGFLGEYIVDLYYSREGAVSPVMRATFIFEAGA